MQRKFFSQVLALAALMLVFTASDQAQTAGPRALITQAIDESRLVTLPGNTRPEANSQNDLGPVSDDLHLDMYLQLKRSPEQDLAARQFVESLTDKTSPNFHKWITAAEYGRRFGVAPEDIATVSGWLESYGFTVNGVPANNMVIDFSGNAGQVREAFRTEIHALDAAGKRHFANMSDPQIPGALLPAVTGVVSLNDFMPHPMFVPRTQYTVSSYYSLIVPGDLATIYNLNPVFAGGYTGQGQTIVVVEDTDLYNGTGDWSVFRKTFGLDKYANGSLTQVHPAPGKGGACVDPGVNGDDGEAAIDVEWASAAAPNAAIVMASCAGTTNFGGFIALQNMLTNGGPLPSVVSISYGDSETDEGASGNSFIDTLYQTAAAAGVSVFVSSGDEAAAETDHRSEVAIRGVSVSGFASTPYNVAVGGTDFGDTAAGTTGTFWNTTNGAYYDSAKSYVPEIPWNNSCASLLLANYYGFGTAYGPSSYCNSTYNWLNAVGGSGGPSGCATGTPALNGVVGGTCAGYAKPAWQSVFGNPSDGVRDLPDVSLFAASGIWGHYYVFCITDGASCSGAPSTWAGAGGTSFASPIMAGIQALIDQALATNNAGNPNPVYYQIAQSEYGTSAGRAACDSTTGPASTCSFIDVTKGDMAVPCVGAFNCYLGGGGIGVLSTSNTSYEPAYGAAPGWDFATGIGTVNAYNLLNAFVDSVAPSSAPAAPVLVSPANGATGVSPGISLTWNASAGATSYDVYLGTAPTPPLVANTTNIDYAPGTLSPGHTYYWAIGARNAMGANAATAWSFTTNCVSLLNPSSATAPAAGGAGTIPVTAATGCAWTAVSNVPWIAITSGASGSGSGTVGYTVAASTGAQRAGTIAIAGQTFTVTQAVYPLISTLAGGAILPTTAPGASVSIPVQYGVAADASGNVYFPVPNLNAVFKAGPSGAVTRIAGSGVAGFWGDGGPALSAQLNNPNGVAVDSSGNVFIADTNNFRVRKVDGLGNIATVAGNGNCCGYTGDGGAATSAQIGSPYGLAVDSFLNLYISDIRNCVVRKVTASGIISTVAGNGTYGYSGDGGEATSAEFRYPYGVAVDAAGNLYIADAFNLRIRMVSTSGTVTTVAGNGSCCYNGDGGAATSAELAYPAGVAVDASGNLYIADSENSRIRKVAPGGTIATVAGNGSGYGFSGDGGAATSAQLANPEGVAMDASGNLYIADQGNARIRKVSAAGIIATLAGGALGDGGPAVFGFLNQPAAVARDNAGNTYIADTNNNRVRKIAANGTIATVAGTGAAGYSGDGAAASAQLSGPRGLALDASGSLYIADTNNHRVRKVDSSGNISTVAGNGYCCGYTGDGGAATSAQIGSPYGLAVDTSGNLYFSDISNNVVRKVAASGIIATVAGNGTYGYSGDTGAATSAKLSYPAAVAVDAGGNLYIADTNNYRIRMVSTNGTIATVAGNGTSGYSGDGGLATSAEVASPEGVAVDAAGNLYIADTYNYRVRMVSASGTIATVAGNGSFGYSGDGGPATSATFGYPYAVCTDASGNVAVVDHGSNVVRLLTPAGTQPVLTVQSAHAGSFASGSPDAYTVTVNNAAMAGATTGAVTVTETLPALLTLAGMSGSGWSCTGSTCSRGDSLIGGSSYPPITVTVNVGATTQSQVTNLVAVSGGGAAEAGAGDFTLVLQAPALSIAKTHSGNFALGQNGAAYTVTVGNAAGRYSTSGPVTATETVPSGMTLVSMAGTGWTCPSGGNTCTRSDALEGGSSYPAIAVTVNVASNAASQATNQVTVSGGGSASASASDATTIAGIEPTISLVANAAGESPIIAPNTWVEIKGANLAPAGDSRSWQGSDFVGGKMPVQLDGVGATVNGKAAYVEYVSPTQLNILTPPDAMLGAVMVQVTNNGTASAAFTAQSLAESPSFFVLGGGPYVAATHANGSLLGPASLYPGSTTPAKPGEEIVIYANGFGPTSPAAVSGSATQSGTLSPPPAIAIGGVAASVVFAGLNGTPGEFQFNAIVPASLANGDQPITTTYNGLTTQAGILIAVQR
jgi:uncharacterized protein (TIGR03437 family)